MKQDIIPFRALRFNPEKVDPSLAVSPPYDVISEGLQAELYDRSPFNMVRIDYGKTGPADHDGDNRYTRARALFEEWQATGVLVRDAEPSIYLYEQDYESEGHRHARRGFFALKRVQEFGKGNVLPHEKTLSGPKADRLLLMKATSANLSPIFSLYMDQERATASLLEPCYAQKPVFDFLSGKIRERLWKVSDPVILSKLQTLLEKKSFFIADGHHRYETAVNYSRETGGDTDYILMFFSEMSDPGLVILPTHRVVKNWPGFDRKRFGEKVREFFDVLEVREKADESFRASLEKHGQSRLVLGLVFPEAWIVAARPGSLASLPPALQKVDTAILHQVILRDILGMKDEEEKNPQHLSFVKEAGQALGAIQDPGTSLVILLNKPRMDVLEAVAAAGLILPPKTTYFYPKILTGLVINTLPISA